MAKEWAAGYRYTPPVCGAVSAWSWSSLQIHIITQWDYGQHPEMLHAVCLLCHSLVEAASSSAICFPLVVNSKSKSRHQSTDGICPTVTPTPTGDCMCCWCWLILFQTHTRGFQVDLWLRAGFFLLVNFETGLRRGLDDQVMQEVFKH